MTLETIETTEELLFINNEKDFDESRGDAWTVEGGARMQSVQSEQVTSHSQEVKKKYVIRSVTDPLTSQEVSIQDAIARGVVVMERGIYCNPETGSYLTIPEAMQRNLIKVRIFRERFSI